MYAATGFETLTSGMGTGAFSVLLLRMTQKRFSATQYALFSSLFGLPRLVAGPLSGFLADAIGWRNFFLFTLACGIPGLALLARFVPPGVREPTFTVEPPRWREPLSTTQLATRGLMGGVAGAAVTALLLATVAALKAMSEQTGFDLGGALVAILQPGTVAEWLQLVAIVLIGAIAGLFTAAVSAARHGTGGAD
jgi:PAT family beta-lactamase induction signal transducer AmpG